MARAAQGARRRVVSSSSGAVTPGLGGGRLERGFADDTRRSRGMFGAASTYRRARLFSHARARRCHDQVLRPAGKPGDISGGGTIARAGVVGSTADPGGDQSLPGGCRRDKRRSRALVGRTT